MAYINEIDLEKADLEQKAAFIQEKEKNGRVTNMKKTLLHSVISFKVMMEWYTLRDKLIPIIGERAFNFYCYAISNENDCLICSMVFVKILKDQGINYANFNFTEQEQLLINFGTAIVKDSHNVPESIFKELKQKFNDEQVILLTTFATQMIATNSINNILHVNLDNYLDSYKGGF
ncbi:carboxymuconolactone decarboxylase family protein [Loigolactobacillus backii]|uniref:carboxymuconolactone decarboxylase family protein n=1 Tax=Loigolactobacillus backii TaxID=375175 RepID=UPI000C1CBDBD|nr:hypothetical protein [Loigolactobacillus backii]MDA5387410.1 hypothetical protein [Loigolactobacillus backii]MDA5389949.1 hypothetical protein [Loigolactobacillus backii]PIO82636.1 hypothetical protein BSQ39_03150 [Loigolactobacillus backii]